VLASHAHNNKYIYSCGTIALRGKQVQACSFRGLLLVTVGPSKPLSAGRVPQSTPSRPQSNLKHKEPAAAKAGSRSRDLLLKELTGIAAEVTGTTISADAPLMDSGLDSIGATELSNKISAHLNTELSPTLLFDHPSLRSIADALSNDQETEDVLGPEVETVKSEPRADLELVQRPQQSAKAQSTPAVVETISSTLSDILGTTVATDAPLMSVGLDSISATEFTNALAEKFDTELPQTLMFDHPTIDAMASFIAETTEGLSPRQP
jgi:acyl carrier protein